jgi:hypothetical protein
MIKTLPGTPAMRSFAEKVTYQMLLHRHEPTPIYISVNCPATGERNIEYRFGKPMEAKKEPDPNSLFVNVISEKIEGRESFDGLLKRKISELRKVLATEEYVDGNIAIGFKLGKGRYEIEDFGMRYISRVLADFSEIKKPKSRPVVETGYPAEDVPPGTQLQLFQQF